MSTDSDYVTTKTPVCWVGDGTIHYDQAAFGMLDAEGQNMVREYGRQMLEQWREAQAAQQFSAAVAEPVTIPATPAEVLVAACEQMHAATAAFMHALSGLADAVRTYQPTTNPDLWLATLEAELSRSAANANTHATDITDGEDTGHEPQH
ncbi:hypothetical protein [Lysobacter niastensis]|uniref:Uncharacterized protein n=1 Tax=Lysobacter niastensis TaxID=380629 RepID=A0ABS0B2U3_9GAMM|nr:hypothetical protein [Lysobacter niastensis]MBF6022804.1 hypothetical protein [Lysobacter niastensis]